MSMSDCEKCWDGICSCGWQYRKMDRKTRIRIAANILGVTVEQIEANWLLLPIPEVHPMRDKS